jgi:hypothetical protein
MLIAAAADAADALRIAFYISAGVVVAGLIPVTAGWIALFVRALMVARGALEAADGQNGPWQIFTYLVKKSAQVAYDSTKDGITRTIAIGMLLVVLGLIPTVVFGTAWATAAGLQDNGGGSTTTPTGTEPTTTGP